MPVSLSLSIPQAVPAKLAMALAQSGSTPAGSSMEDDGSVANVVTAVPSSCPAFSVIPPVPAGADSGSYN